MANTLGVYNPIFYAQEALKHLHLNLGMAGRVHRGYEQERRTYGKGDTISIRRPSTFAAADAPATAADLTTESVDITLNKWREVKFKLTDKELASTTEQIIAEHIEPAAYELARDLDVNMVSLYKDVGAGVAYNTAANKAATNCAGVRKLLVDAGVPMGDLRKLHLMVDTTVEQDFLLDTAFALQSGAGDEGTAVQRTGSLGMKYGFNVFANQNTPSHTGGTGAALSGAVNGATAKGATTVAIDGLTNGETFLAGDTFTIAGDSQTYALTADATVATGAISASISPPLQAAAADNAVVTFNATDDYSGVNLAWHQNAFALVLAPLPEMGNELGAKVASVTDPVTRLSLRSRVYYVGNSSEVHVALDILYGYKTLDSRFAARLNRT